MGKYYIYENDKNEKICVFRLESFSVSSKDYSVGFFDAKTAKFLSRTKRCFNTAEEAQLFLDQMAHLHNWRACDM